MSSSVNVSVHAHGLLHAESLCMVINFFSLFQTIKDLSVKIDNLKTELVPKKTTFKSDVQVSQ